MTTPTETPTPTPRVDEKWRQLPDGSESALHEMKACARQLERELTAATAQLEEARRVLGGLVEDGECYCADNVAVKTPCGHCVAMSVIGANSGGLRAVLFEAEGLCDACDALRNGPNTDSLRAALAAMQQKEGK